MAILEYIHHVAYVVDDLDHAIRVFRDLFELEMIGRQICEGERRFEMATFRCGPTFIELMRPISFPALEQFLRDHGPGLSHVAFAVKNLPEKIKKLQGKGIEIEDPGAFVAGTGWTIANFDHNKSDLPYFRDPYHNDHLAEAEEKS
jgi:methylmalonyl-CoA/ethylmalonyl-CoA epimerase